QHAAWTNGFLQGYNTMDALAALAFGVTVITAIRSFKLKNDRQVAIATAKGGAVGIIGIALIYIGLIYLGATSLHHFTMAENGGITLAQIAHFYLGTFGDALL
ncbi:branched-chain amino acid transport system II carrier protein, partial [Ligilactobacillus salivarius]